MDHSRPPFRLFSSFQTNITILQQINVKNVDPVLGFEPTDIRTHGPSEHESPPITTKPVYFILKIGDISTCLYKWPWGKAHGPQAQPGGYPIKILQRKIYATIIFKHPDWLINLSSQSECLKIA